MRAKKSRQKIPTQQFPEALQLCSPDTTGGLGEMLPFIRLFLFDYLYFRL